MLIVQDWWNWLRTRSNGQLRYYVES